MNKKIRNTLVIFVIVSIIIVFKTERDWIKFVSAIFIIAGIFWLIVDDYFKRKGCEICHETIAEIKDTKGRKVCLSCHNKEIAVKAKEVKIEKDKK